MEKNHNAEQTSNRQLLRTLIIDDSENDALLMIRELKKGGYNPLYERVDTAAAMEKALKEKQWDIILCDYNMPKFSAPSAIAVSKKASSDTPIIIVSGTIGEATAVECMRLGAQDYIMKANFSRLCPAIDRELKEAKIRSEQKHLESQKKSALEALLQSEEKYRTILENIEDGYFEIDLSGNFTFFNDSTCRCLGYSKEELMGVNYKKYTNRENAKKLFNTFNEAYKTGMSSRILEYEIIRKDGTKRLLEGFLSLQKDSAGNPILFRGMIRDITKRKRAEESLRKSEELYTRLVNAIPDVIVRTDLEGNILFVNDYAFPFGGYSREEMEGQNLLTFIAPENHAEAIKNLQLMMDGRLGPREYSLLLKDGRKVPFEVNGDVLRNKDGKPFGIVTVCRDISERRRAVEIIRENEERLRGIARNLPGIIFQFYIKDNGEYGVSYVSERLGEFLEAVDFIDQLKEEDRFPVFVSQIHEEDRGKFTASIKTAAETRTPWNFEGRIFALSKDKMLWFQGLATPTLHGDQLTYNGILLNITERKLAEEKSRHSEEKFYKVFMTTPDCIAITRLKDGLMIDVNQGYEDIVGWKREDVIGRKSTEPPQNFWVDPAARNLMVADLKAGKDILHREFEFRRSDGSIRSGIYSARPIGINGESCLIFILQDITEHKRMDAELQRTLSSLRKAFGTTIRVMISAVEMRDPYTAGHQTRTADIARAIATEMGLDQGKIDGIRMAGVIHDIGKLSIPAEILTKTTKLTKIEYSLIKEHSLSGYEMLKDIESPWPLAEIVYQHHERIDGSGYPRNLKGNEILIEARIMGVADVVEAMASHRPYRASLGIETALEEIKKNRGILYDEAVVDACVRLFREKGYQLP